MRFKQKIAVWLVVFSMGMAVSLQARQAGSRLTLEQCVSLALERNSQVLNSQRRLKIAQTNVVTTRAAIMPRLSTSVNSGVFEQGPRTTLFDVPVGRDPETGTVIYEQQEIVQQAVQRNFNSLNFTLSQTIYDFGKTYSNLKQVRATKEATEYTYESTQQNIILQVYQGYYQLLQNIQLLEVAEEAVKQSEEQLKRTKSMYEIGAAALADVYRAQTTLGNDRITLLNQKTAVQNARYALNVILGREADAPLEIVDVDDAQPAQYSLESVLEQAFANNPDLRRFKAEMAAASHGLKAAKATFLPSVAASVSYSRSNDDINKVYSGYDKNYSINYGISLSFNLFNGFADAANVERRSTEYRIAQESYNERRRQIRQEVLQALDNLKTAQEIAAINNENLISAQEDLRLAQERYRVGAGTLLDVITAQVNLTRARSTLVRAKYDIKIFEAQLKARMGALK